MSTFTKIAVGAAAALSMAALAAPSHATVFAQFAPNTNAYYSFWTQDGAQTGGTFAGTAATQIKFFDGPNAFQWLDATFTIHGTITNSPATFDAVHGTYTQSVGTVANPGTFSFIYTGPTGGGLVNNENLLSGTFVNAWIQGSGTQGGFAETMANLGTVTFTSAYENFLHSVVADNGFTIDLSLPHNQSIVSSLPGTRALKSFNASAGGRFSDNVLSVPEPATWAMMLIGFGGMGAMLRSRRRQALSVA